MRIKGMKLTRPVQVEASQLISSVLRTSLESREHGLSPTG